MMIKLGYLVTDDTRREFSVDTETDDVCVTHIPDNAVYDKFAFHTFVAVVMNEWSDDRQVKYLIYRCDSYPYTNEWCCERIVQIFPNIFACVYGYGLQPDQALKENNARMAWLKSLYVSDKIYANKCGRYNFRSFGGDKACR